MAGLNKARAWLQQQKQRRGAKALCECKKEKEMNQIDQQDPCELLRTAGFTEAEIEHLERLRRAYSENSSWLTSAEERRLAFARWPLPPTPLPDPFPPPLPQTPPPPRHPRSLLPLP